MPRETLREMLVHAVHGVRAWRRTAAREPIVDQGYEAPGRLAIPNRKSPGTIQ